MKKFILLTLLASGLSAHAMLGSNQKNGRQSNEGPNPTIEQQRQKRVQIMKEKEAAERNAEEVKTQAERAQGNAVDAIERQVQAERGQAQAVQDHAAKNLNQRSEDESDREIKKMLDDIEKNDKKNIAGIEQEREEYKARANTQKNNPVSEQIDTTQRYALTSKEGLKDARANQLSSFHIHQDTNNVIERSKLASNPISIQDALALKKSGIPVIVGSIVDSWQNFWNAFRKNNPNTFPFNKWKTAYFDTVSPEKFTIHLNDISIPQECIKFLINNRDHLNPKNFMIEKKSVNTLRDNFAGNLEILSYLTGVVSLHCCHNTQLSISKENFTIFLKNNANTLELINFQDSNMGATSCRTLSSLLSNLSNLKFLNLKGNKISTSAKFLASALAKIDGLICLNVASNDIKEDEAKILLYALSTHKKLYSLYLNHNNIGNEGVQAFVDALSQTPLKIVNLSDNNITDKGAEALAKALLNNTTLEELYLSYNNITDKGATALRGAISKNGTLKKLYFNQRSNPVSEQIDTNQRYALTSQKDSVNKDSVNALVKQLSSLHIDTATQPAMTDSCKAKAKQMLEKKSNLQEIFKFFSTDRAHYVTSFLNKKIRGHFDFGFTKTEDDSKKNSHFKIQNVLTFNVVLPPNIIEQLKAAIKSRKDSTSNPIESLTLVSIQNALALKEANQPPENEEAAKNLSNEEKNAIALKDAKIPEIAGSIADRWENFWDAFTKNNPQDLPFGQWLKECFGTVSLKNIKITDSLTIDQASQLGECAIPASVGLIADSWLNFWTTFANSNPNYRPFYPWTNLPFNEWKTACFGTVSPEKFIINVEYANWRGLMDFFNANQAQLNPNNFMIAKTTINTFHDSFDGNPEILSYFTEVTALRANYGKIPISSEHFKTFLHNNANTLEELNFSCNKLDAELCKTLLSLLSNLSSLKFLDLSYNKINWKRATDLFFALSNHKKLNTLDLNNNNIGNEGMQALIYLLSQTPLKELNLSRNCIGAQEAHALADALHNNSTLEELNLQHNNIGDRVWALAEALRNNRTLKILNLSYNNIGLEGAMDLMSAISLSDTTIKTLNLQGNDIHDKTKFELRKVCREKNIDLQM